MLSRPWCKMCAWPDTLGGWGVSESTPSRLGRRNVSLMDIYVFNCFNFVAGIMYRCIPPIHGWTKGPQASGLSPGSQKFMCHASLNVALKLARCTGDGTMSEADRSALQATENKGQQAIPQREADLVPLWAAVTRASNASAYSARQQAYAALSSKLDERAKLDAGVRTAVLDVLNRPEVAAIVKVGLVDLLYTNVNQVFSCRLSIFFKPGL